MFRHIDVSRRSHRASNITRDARIQSPIAGQRIANGQNVGVRTIVRHIGVAILQHWQSVFVPLHFRSRRSLNVHFQVQSMARFQVGVVQAFRQAWRFDMITPAIVHQTDAIDDIAVASAFFRQLIVDPTVLEFAPSGKVRLKFEVIVRDQ